VWPDWAKIGDALFKQLLKKSTKRQIFKYVNECFQSFLGPFFHKMTFMISASYDYAIPNVFGTYFLLTYYFPGFEPRPLRPPPWAERFTCNFCEVYVSFKMFEDCFHNFSSNWPNNTLPRRPSTYLHFAR
jgi:hypothetical protein